MLVKINLLKGVKSVHIKKYSDCLIGKEHKVAFECQPPQKKPDRGVGLGTYRISMQIYIFVFILVNIYYQNVNKKLYCKILGRLSQVSRWFFFSRRGGFSRKFLSHAAHKFLSRMYVIMFIFQLHSKYARALLRVDFCIRITLLV